MLTFFSHSSSTFNLPLSASFLLSLPTRIDAYLPAWDNYPTSHIPLLFKHNLLSKFPANSAHLGALWRATRPTNPPSIVRGVRWSIRKLAVDNPACQRPNWGERDERRRGLYPGKLSVVARLIHPGISGMWTLLDVVLLRGVGRSVGNLGCSGVQVNCTMWERVGVLCVGGFRRDYR